MNRAISRNRIVNRRVNMLSFAWLSNSLAYSIVYPFIPIYLHSERGFPMSQVGLVFPIMGAGLMLGPAVSGFMVDRFGRQKVLYGGTFFRGLMFMIMAVMAWFDTSFWTFAAALFLSSFTGMFFQNAADAYLSDITTPAERPLAYSRIRIGTNIGWALGPMIGAFLARSPFSLLFAITGLTCFGISYFIRQACPETIKPCRKNKLTHLSEQSTWRILLSDKRLMLTGLCIIVLYMLVSQLYSTFSIYATSVAGISKNSLGFIYSVNGITVVLAQIPVSRLLSKIDLHKRLIMGSFLYVIGYYSIAFGDNCLYFMFSVALLTFGEIVAQPALYSIISVMAPSGMLGRYMGVLGLTSGLGYALGPYAGALMFEQWSDFPAGLWGGLSVFGMIAMFGFFILMRSQHRHKSVIA